jgi:hypothetical protein
MDAIQRALVAYYRTNVAAWVALKRLMPRDADPWLLAAVALLAAVVTLLLSGHPDAALMTGASSPWLLVLQRATER